MTPEEHVRKLMAVNARQKQGLANLTRQVEQLERDKAALRFDLHKLRAENEQLRNARHD